MDHRRLKTAVLLDSGLETLGNGLDLRGLRQWLQENDPAVHIQLIDGLTQRPGDITGVITGSGSTRVVLGLSSGNYWRGGIETRVRKAGLDPVGIETVNLGVHASMVHARLQATEKAKLLLSAAIARARAFSGSGPENLKPHLPEKVSRRAFFSLFQLEYRAVPSVEEERCVCATGCRLCVRACRQGALKASGDRVKVEKSFCQSCGLCLAACPRQAIEFPGYSAEQLRAGLGALLDPALGALESRGILFMCHRSVRILETLAGHGLSYPAGWLPFEVPCLGMISPGWVLGCLAMGAAAAALVLCNDRCPFGQAGLIEQRIAYCRQLLERLGGSPDKVRGFHVDDRSGWTRPPDGLSERALSAPASTAAVLGYDANSFTNAVLHLAQEIESPEGFALAHAGSPVGVIHIGRDGCTGCGVCASACPTGSLALERDDHGVSLTFDGALCTACGQCLPRCPGAKNGVLRLERVTDLGRLSGGRTELYRSGELQCEGCGAPIASQAMISHLKALLGDQRASCIIERYCPGCRGALATGFA